MMSNQTTWTVLQMLSFYLLLFPGGLPWYFGNLSIYVQSLWTFKTDFSLTTIAWVIPSFMASLSLGMIGAGILLKKISAKWIMFIGVTMFVCGFFMSRITLMNSEVGFIFTLGIMTGCGQGFIVSEVMARVIRLDTKRTGLAFSIIIGAFNIGAIFYDLESTWKVNPENSNPDFHVLGNFNVFSDTHIINSVGDLFVLLSIESSVMQFSGVLLSLVLGEKGLCGADEKKAQECEKTNDRQEQHCYFCNEVIIEAGNDSERENDDDDDNSPSNSNPIVTNCSGPIHSEEMSNYNNCNNGNTVISETSQGHNSIENNTNTSFTPVEMVKTKDVFFVVMAFISNDLSFIALLNFYKIYGALWIPDDHFLSNIGIAMLITITLIGPLWGMILDRFGVKKTQMLISFSWTLVCVYFYFTPQLSKWLMAVWTAIGACLACAALPAQAMMTKIYFGDSHFSTNYGILCTLSFVMGNIIQLFMMKCLLYYLGWFAVFINVAIINLVSLITVMLFWLDN